MSSPQTRADILTRNSYYETHTKPLVGTGKPPVVWRFKRDDQGERKKTLENMDNAWPPTIAEVDALTGGRP